MEDIEQATNLEIARQMDPEGWEREEKKKEWERRKVNEEYQATVDTSMIGLSKSQKKKLRQNK